MKFEISFKQWLWDFSGNSKCESNNFQDHTPQYYDIEFRCLQYALFGCCFFQLAGSFCFLVMSWYVLEDKNEADRIISEANAINNETNEDEHASIVQNEIVPTEELWY